MKMNLEQTVQYLLDATGTGVRIEAFLTDPNDILPSAETFGNYYIVTIDEVPHLFVVTKNPALGEEVYDKIDLGEWPKPGAQGVPGPQGQAPEIKISAAGTWVINGIDTKKPSRGIKGEQGPAGVGRPGLGVTAMLGIDGEDYSPDVTKLDDGYDLYSTMADITYDAGDSTQTIPVEFKYLIKTNAFEEQAEALPTGIHFTKNVIVDGSVNTNQVMVPSFSNIKSPSTDLDKQLQSKMPKPVNSPLYNYSFVYGTGGAWSSSNTHVMQGIAGGINANTVMMRDSFGRAGIADPSSATDIANKRYVDSKAGGGGVIVAVSGEYDERCEDIVPHFSPAQFGLVFGSYIQGKSVTVKVEDEDNGNYYYSVVYAWGDAENPFVKMEANAGYSLVYYVDGTVKCDVFEAPNVDERRETGTHLYHHIIHLTKNSGALETLPTHAYLHVICQRDAQMNSISRIIAGLVNGYTNAYMVRYLPDNTIEQGDVVLAWTEAPDSIRIRYYTPWNEVLNVFPLGSYTISNDQYSQMT